MFKVGDVVFVSNRDTDYEKKNFIVRDHMSFFGTVTEVEERPGFQTVGVKFPATPNGYEIEWYYLDTELSHIEDIKDMTIEEFCNKYNVSILAEYLERRVIK